MKRRPLLHPLSTFLLIVAISLPAAAQAARETSDAELFLKGRFAAEDGRLEEALAIFDQLVEGEPSNPILHYERAKVLLDLRRFDDAERGLRRTIGIDPSFYDARKLIGRMLLDRSAGQRNRIEEALEHLQIAFQLQPNDLASGLTVSQILMGLGKIDEAKKIVEALLDRTPDHRSVNYQYAQVLLRLGERVEAARYLEAVLVQEPFYRPAIMQLLEIYEEVGRWSDAADLIASLLIQETDNAELRRQHAYLLLRADRNEEAREILESLHASAPEDAATSYLLAEVLAELREHESAEKHFRAALLARADDPDLVLSFGLNQLALEDFETAQAQFERVLEIDGLPARVRAIAATQLAAIDHHRERYDQALARARGLLEIEGIVNMQAVNIALDVLRRQEDYASALRMVDSLIGEREEAPVLKARKIEFLALSGAADEAARLAAEQAAKGLESGLMAAQIFGQMDRYEEALEVLDAIDPKFRENVDYLFQLGASYERTGRIEEAERTFQALLESDPEHAATLNYLGYMWADRGVRLDEAEKLVSEAVRQYPRNGAYVDSLGWVYFKQGRLDLAEKHLLDAAELIPDDPTIQEHLGDLFVTTGDLDRAMSRYNLALELDPDDREALLRKMRELEKKIAARLTQ